MMRKNSGMYGFLGTSRVLITYNICPPVNSAVLKVHSNQNLIWCVKIGVYMGFWVHRGS